MTLEVSTILITGAAAGVGEALAENYQGQGARVIKIDTAFETNRDKLQFKADIKSVANLRRVRDYPEVRSHVLDALFLCAGITQSKPGFISLEEQRNLLKVNVKGTQNCFEIFYSLVKPGGTITFLSSDLINSRDSDLQFYVLTKKEIARYAAAKAAEFKSLRIVTLLPGPIDTILFRRNKTNEQLQQIEERVGILKPSEFADIVVNTILPDRAAFPTGSRIVIYKNSLRKLD